jgi:predicted RNA binding protein YcfA (HicA-like mRNA interferase family)
MPNGLRNWSYRDVLKFLKEKGFVFHKELGGSHEAWVCHETQAIVEVNRTSSAYPPRTLETMIRQSKLSKKEWRGSN